MRNALLILLALLPLLASAQDVFMGIPRDSASGRIAYTAIVQVPGASKNELYVRAKAWAANAFRSAKDVLQMDDKEAGVLIGKTVYRSDFVVFTSVSPNYVQHTVKIEVKDGRYRYTFNDFHLVESSGMLGVSKNMEDQIEVSSKSMGSGVKSGNPKGLYKTMLNGVRVPAELEVNSLRAAMQVKSADF